MCFSGYESIENQTQVDKLSYLEN